MNPALQGNPESYHFQAGPLLALAFQISVNCVSSRAVLKNCRRVLAQDLQSQAASVGRLPVNHTSLGGQG